jgi:hypothetical protein
VHLVTEIDFVDGDEVSNDVVQNYKKRKAAEIPSCPLLAPLNAHVSEVPHGLLDFARTS